MTHVKRSAERNKKIARVKLNRWLATETLKEELDYINRIMKKFITKAEVHYIDGKINPFVKADIEGASIIFTLKEIRYLVKDITNG